MTTPAQVACAVLRRDGRLLLWLRSSARLTHPSVWDLPGGHLEDGETPRDALIRELAEELGIAISTDACHLLTDFVRPAVVLSVFVVDDWTGTVRNAAPEEHVELRWVDPGEIDHLHIADEEYRSLLATACEWSPENA